MPIKIVTQTSPEQPTGVAQYWHRLCLSLKPHGIAVEWVPLSAWTKGQVSAAAARDIIIVDNQNACAIAPEFAVIAVQHGCAMEHGLRCHSEHVNMGRAQWEAAQRGRTFWVACSDWAAYHCRKHMGIHADRIIFGCADTAAFFPAERQRLRDTHFPVILHHARDPNKGSGVIGRVKELLGAEFEVRLLDAPAAGVPDALREADMWLSLSKSEGLPTVVQEALATDLLVVGSDVGVLWPYAHGEAVHGAARGAVAWLNAEIGALVYNWVWRDYPEHVAAWVRAAWKCRDRFHGRDYARRWWNAALFAQKWLEAISAAATALGVEIGVGSVPRPTGASEPHIHRSGAGRAPRPYPQPQIVPETGTHIPETGTHFDTPPPGILFPR